MFLKPSSNNANAANVPARIPPGSKKSVPSVVSSDMHVLGNIVSEGIVDFDGTIDGNIRCVSMVLRHNGKVNGEIHADNVQVFGKVKGLIKAKAVQLHSTCTVEGIIMHEVISIEDGAVIEGKIKRTNKTTASAGGNPILTDEEFTDEYEGGGANHAHAEDGGYHDGTHGDGNNGHLMENIRLIAG